MQKIYLAIIVLVLAMAAFLIITDTKLPAMSPLPTGEATPTGTTPPNDTPNLIKVELPKSNDLIKSPVTVKGEARGNWFFEASFPIRIYDGNGVELGVAVAQAQGEWMTEDFVPFNVNLKFKKPTTKSGTLVLQKDNPSGLPEYDADLRIPVIFDLENWMDEPIVPMACKVTGCSGQICADEDVVTTCEFKTEYACYKTAKCELQEDGKCGWTPTEELVMCLSEAFQEEGI